MLLELRCTRRFPGFGLELDARLELEGIVGLFGPSGGGKTTLLRIVAGLDKGVQGRLRCAGQDWLDSDRGLFVPPHRRQVGLVFQDARLFPHLSVAGNLHYASRRCRGPIRYEEVLRALDLAPLLARRPQSLSGGERQRVAVGRALLSQPELLLLDEPLSALDHARKQEILPYLRRLPEQFGLPLVYVSHDLEELGQLSSTLLLLEQGRLAGPGSIEEQWRQRGTRPPRDGLCAELLATVAGAPRAGDAPLLRLAGNSVPLPAGAWQPGESLRLRVPARDVALSVEAPGASSFPLVLPCVLVAAPETQPDGLLLQLRLADGQLLFAQVDARTIDSLPLQAGQALFALVQHLPPLERLPAQAQAGTGR